MSTSTLQTKPEPKQPASQKERRIIPIKDLHIESRGEGDDATQVIRGHAAIFNALSEEMWGFKEQIAKGAFSEVLDDDVRALFNHDPNFIIGRTISEHPQTERG